MIEQLLISGLFLVLLSSLIFTDWPPLKIFVGTMLAAYFLGLVNTEEVLAKLSNTGLITLLLLLLVSVGLEKLSWLKRLSVRLVSVGFGATVLRISVVTALFSAFFNNTAVVATLAQTVRNNRQHPASRLLIPLSYAAILGGTMTLIGTSTNLIVSSFLEDATGESLAFFDFFAVGASATLAGIAAILFGCRFLPRHNAEEIDVNDYLIETEVGPDSSLIGRTIAENGLRDLDDLFLVELVRDEHLISPVAPSEYIEAGDKLIFTGDISHLSDLEAFEGLQLFAVEEGLLRENLTEVIVMPNASIEGKTLKQAGFRSLFDAAVVGMRRGGKALSGKLGNITIQAGDNLMLATGQDFHDRKNLSKNFVVIDDSVNGANAPVWQNWLISLGLLAVVVLASLELVPLIKGLALLLVCMLGLGLVRGSELRRRFPFEIWLIISSALTLSEALSNSGLVAVLSELLHDQLELLGPHAALAGIYLGTLLLTEVMTNNAAAALSFPLAFGLAESYGLSPMPFVMAVAYGASASFLTPYGYTTNLMVQNLGGYSMRDYVRAGLPVSLAYSSVVLILLPLVFPF